MKTHCGRNSYDSIIQSSIENPRIVARFLSKIRVQNDCWLWNGGLTPDGYGRFWMCSGKTALAHRFSKILYDGMPERSEMTVDHATCGNKWCVKPSHLEFVTLQENISRARRTHCLRGHEYTEENTKILRAGYRDCRKCRYASTTKWAKNNKARLRQLQKEYVERKKAREAGGW